jgi:hypothetical protein
VILNQLFAEKENLNPALRGFRLGSDQGDRKPGLHFDTRDLLRGEVKDAELLLGSVGFARDQKEALSGGVFL